MDIISGILLITVGVIAMGQRAYYTRKITVMNLEHAGELMLAHQQGQLAALNNPHAVVASYHRMFTYTMN